MPTRRLLARQAALLSRQSDFAHQCTCRQLAPSSSSSSSSSSLYAPSSSRSNSRYRFSTTRLIAKNASSTSSSTSTSGGAAAAATRRALLYVPGSDERKLRKSFKTEADAICFDLEDSVATDRKAAARETVLYALNAADGKAERLVRINSPSSGLAQDDLEIVLASPQLQGIVIPKVHSAEDILFVEELIEEHAHPNIKERLRLVASIESAKAIMNLREIASASKRIDSLLFAAEDFCADTGIARTEDRKELLFARSAVVVAAKAFGLSAIDLVCIHYQDQEALLQEAEEGRKLGFDAKQVIHPAQVSVVQSAFSPSAIAIDKARRILEQYGDATKAGKGAYGLAGGDGRRSEMIDAPMILQAQRVLSRAQQFGLA